MKSLEIFSGAGGLAEGLRYSGFNHLALLEINKDACNSLRLNFSYAEILETDIKEFDYSLYKGIDFIAGGPPCQPFSLGGKAKGSQDSRDMFPHAIRGIRELKPKAFMFENVKGLLRQSFSSYFNYIILQLTYPDFTKGKNEVWTEHLSRLEKVHTKGCYDGLKYNIVYRLINAANYGIPQKRERVIIVGVRDSLNIDWSFPEETHSHDRLLWDKFVTGEYWDRNNVLKSKIEKITPQLKKTIEKLKDRYGFFSPESKPWVTVREALAGLPDPQLKTNKLKDHVFRAGAKSYLGHTGSYIDEPSKTIKAGDHGVPGGENMIRFEDDSVRYFTILEAKRIQTFHDNYSITGSWSEGMRQLGNAVPVELSKKIGEELFKKLSYQQ